MNTDEAVEHLRNILAAVAARLFGVHRSSISRLMAQAQIVNSMIST